MQFIAIAVFLVIAAAYLLHQYRQRAFAVDDEATASSDQRGPDSDELKAA